jgi:predicted DNA-binding ribbon-helix-helix protein
VSATTIRKRSVVIAGHRTSVSLEDIFWEQLQLIAKHQRISVNALVESIDRERAANLSSAIRVFVLEQQLETDAN